MTHPAVPLPDDSNVRVPLEITLKRGWEYDSKTKSFVSNDGERCEIIRDLPKGTKLVPKVPALQRIDVRGLSRDEAELRRHWQAILPRGQEAGRFARTVRQWPCIERAEPGPDISLPGSGRPAVG